MLFLTAVCTLIISTFKDEYAHDINNSTYRGIPKLLVHLDVEIILRAPLNPVRKFWVRTGSNLFEQVRKKSRIRTSNRISGSVQVCSHLRTWIRVRFGFGFLESLNSLWAAALRSPPEVHIVVPILRSMHRRNVFCLGHIDSTPHKCVASYYLVYSGFLNFFWGLCNGHQRMNGIHANYRTIPS
jgi:hypothetical protein